MRLRAQGATEYLVLLAVVLIIALVAIALLGFFPGTANDAQIAESEIYWRSASPIAIVETANVRTWTVWQIATTAEFRIRNVGVYPLRITKILGKGGSTWISQMYVNTTYLANMSDYLYLAPGEEVRFVQSPSDPNSRRAFEFEMEGTGSSGNNEYLFAAQSICNVNPPAYGMLSVKDFGFEYIQYIEGQQIVKRQIGTKPLIIRCREPY